MKRFVAGSRSRESAITPSPCAGYPMVSELCFPIRSMGRLLSLKYRIRTRELPADDPAKEHRAGSSVHHVQHLLASKKPVGPARWRASLAYEFRFSTSGQGKGLAIFVKWLKQKGNKAVENPILSIRTRHNRMKRRTGAAFGPRSLGGYPLSIDQTIGRQSIVLFWALCWSAVNGASYASQ